MGSSNRPRKEQSRAGAPVPGPITVFLADDHAVLRDALRLMLDMQENISVVGEAGDGREAVRRVKRLHSDVVLMDITMPGLNGIDATTQICQSCPPTVRVIVLSMHSDEEHIYRALSAGAQGYVLKGAAAKQLVDGIRVVHAGKRFLSASVSDVLISRYVDRRGELPPQSPLERLTLRERETMQLVVEGKSSKEIAKTIHLSPRTVDTYRVRIMHKLSVDSLPALVMFAIEHGVTPRP